MVSYCGVMVEPNPGIPNAHNDMNYQACGYFTGFPQKPNSKKCTDNVYFIGLLDGVVVEKTVQLKSYATEVCYCRMKNQSNQNSKLTAIAGYHFDFESTSKRNHPIFHAQQKITAGERFFQFNKDISPPEFPKDSEVRTLRIPTPQMDIFSAIVMTLADHIVPPDKPEAGEPFIKFLNEVNKNLFPINFDASPIDVPKKFRDAHPMHIHDWYPVKRE